MKKTFYIIINIAIIAILFYLSGCEKKDFDTPPINSLKNNQIITIAQLKTFSPNKKIDDTLSVFGYITADEHSGNLYKIIYIQDSTAGIKVTLNSSSKSWLKQGDYIRIILKGLKLVKSNGMLEINQADLYYNIVKQEKTMDLKPDTINFIDDLKKDPNWIGKLVCLKNVQFILADSIKTYANKPALVDESRTLEDITGSTIISRNSAYSDFADHLLPRGKGSFVGILSVYETSTRKDYQLTIRDESEVKLSNDKLDRLIPPPMILSQDFSGCIVNQDINNNGWLATKVWGTKNWYCTSYNSNNYAQMSAYGASDTLNIGWLISPAINLDASTSEYLTFKSKAGHYRQDGLTVWYSTNYDGNTANIETATWIQLNPMIAVSPSNGYGSWTSSGPVDLSLLTGNVYIGFRYKGSGTKNETTTFQIDDIKINGTLSK